MLCVTLCNGRASPLLGDRGEDFPVGVVKLRGEGSVGANQAVEEKDSMQREQHV